LVLCNSAFAYYLRLGQAHGVLALSREIFLGGRDEEDIKSKKQSEEYKEYCAQQKEFESIVKKKRKLDSAATSPKEATSLEPSQSEYLAVQGTTTKPATSMTSVSKSPAPRTTRNSRMHLLS
jgi:hypothetical protein